MAQTGYTPIYLYYSGTATHIPLAANLGNGELAINAADGNLFYKNTSNAVVTIPVLQSSSTQSGWLSSTDWNTFNSKAPAGAYLTSVTADSPLTGAGTSASHLSMPAATGSVNGYLTSTDWTTFNNKQPAGSYLTTVTADSPLTGSGTSGSHLSMPAATGSVNGYLTSTDWTTFNSKQPAGTYVTSVSGTAPVVSSGGTTPAISMAAATGSVNGYLTSTDWTTFNGKQAALVSGTNIKTVSGTSLLGSGDVGTIGTGYGGTGLTSFTSTGVVYASSTSALATGNNLKFNGTDTLTLGNLANFATSGSDNSLTISQSGPLNLYANGATRLRVNTNGQVAIGAAAGLSTESLYVYKSNSLSMIAQSDAIAGAFLYCNTTGATNNVLIDNSNGYNYGVMGVISATGSNGGTKYGLGYTPSAGTAATPVLMWTDAGGVSIGNTTDPGAGNLYVNGIINSGTTGFSNYVFYRSGASAAGDVVGSFASNNGGLGQYHQFCWADNADWNAANSAYKLGRVYATGRSINASGTINASGADYAEYMTKSGDFVIAKGDICGIDATGQLTNLFSDAVTFVVKSTNPSYVGGDSWNVEPQPMNENGDYCSTDSQEFIDWQQRHEEKRALVDRIAFAGQVPVNVLGAAAGQYIIPVNDNGTIKGQSVSNPTFEQYAISVGKVISVEQDGRARIIVKVA